MLLCLIVNKGSAVNMLKVGSKRRRTKQEIAEEKQEEQLKEEAINSKVRAFEQMQ